MYVIILLSSLWCIHISWLVYHTMYVSVSEFIVVLLRNKALKPYNDLSIVKFERKGHI